MIRIERPPLNPEILAKGERFTAEIRQAIGADHRVRDSRARDAALATTRQIRSVFKKGLLWDSLIRPKLEKLFHGKCAYCETRSAAGGPGQISRFRPRLDAESEDPDRRFPIHYAWLAFVWENLYPTCERCERIKRTRFPIVGKRAEVGAFGDVLLREEPLLLDPCADEPSEHFDFQDNGEVRPSSDRGHTSIVILDLNRSDLVHNRQVCAVDVLSIVHEIRGYTRKSRRIALSQLIEQLRQAVEDRAEYAGMARQLVDDYLGSTFERAGLKGVRGFLESELSSNRMATQLARVFDQLESYSLAGKEKASEEDLDTYRARVRLIESIQVKNLKALRDVNIKVRRPRPSEPTSESGETGELTRRSDRAPWMMILGENATGKSTLLKLIALTLVGRDYQEHLQGEPAKYVRQGCKSGFVKVKLGGIRRPHQLTFSAAEAADSGQLRGQTLVLAYGTARLLTKRRTRGFEAPYARADNLFNPQIPLIDVDKWLRGLRRRDAPKFDSVRRALGRVLLFEGDEELFWDDEAKPAELKVRLKDAVVGLDQLSDGYHSVLALVADILSVLLRGWETPERAEGIVLIDELGTHLHPQWRMHVVERLREVLPKVQFIATTHDPLCLRGLEDDEVVVVARNAKGQVYSTQDLPPVKALRVDQLLTSEHFGLSSTQDPRSEIFFKDYYALLAKTDRTPGEEKELSAMRLELPQHGLAGATRRERLMLDAIDYYLAVEPEIDGEERRRASQEALSDVLERILQDTA